MSRRNKDDAPTPVDVLIAISKLSVDEQYEVVERARRILHWREEAERKRAPRDSRCGRLRAFTREELCDA